MDTEKRSLAGAIATMSPKKLREIPVSSLQNALHSVSSGLTLEGQCYMDIRHWKTAPQVMKTININAVPQTQIDLSKGVLKQNPGY